MTRISVVCLCFFGLFFAREAICQSDLIAPITGYSRGYNDRVEYIVAEIHKHHLDKGSLPTESVRDYSKRMGGNYAHDDAGHLIALRLGGTGKETYNIVPHNRVVNRGNWRTKVEAPIYDYVHKGNAVKYEVWPEYASGIATRPNNLTYRVTNPSGSVLLSEGTMENPIPDAR